MDNQLCVEAQSSMKTRNDIHKWKMNESPTYEYNDFVVAPKSYIGTKLASFYF